jgi:hypothetical protein
MISANIDILQMDYEAAISYFIQLENLDNIKRTNGHGPTVAVDKYSSVTSRVDMAVGKKNQRTQMWCHSCGKSIHNMAYCKLIMRAKQHKKAQFEAKA